MATTKRNSLTGVTGARSSLPADLKHFIGRVRAATDKPLSVGFGISSAHHVQEVAGIADGVVVGSAVMHAIDQVSKHRPTQVSASWRQRARSWVVVGTTATSAPLAGMGSLCLVGQYTAMLRRSRSNKGSGFGVVHLSWTFSPEEPQRSITLLADTPTADLM